MEAVRWTIQTKSNKKHSIERLKSLGVTVFEGSTDPANAKAWLNLLEKCYDVMDYLEERKIKLVTFLLKKKVEGWWKSIKARRRDKDTMSCEVFRKIFEDKYYPSTYCKAKREEFLRLK